MHLFKKGLNIILIVSILVASCISDNEDFGPSPDVPPINSFVMDFSILEEGNAGGRVLTSDNWDHAAVNVGFWSAVLALNMAIPVASFKVAITQNASYDKNREVWVWSYNHDFVGRTYTSELTGQINGGFVDWEMRISEENGFQNVLWFSGKTAIDGSNGFWILNKDANNPEVFLKIDWTREGNEIGSISYTDISGGAGDGSFISYGRTTDPIYDLFYTISSTAFSNTVDIEWHETNGNGHVKNPAHFEDSEWHCWDSTFEDIDC